MKSKFVLVILLFLIVISSFLFYNDENFLTGKVVGNACSRTSDCSDSERCIERVCQSVESCIDSDAGEENPLSFKGTVTLVGSLGGVVNIDDSCSDDGNVIEGSCSVNQFNNNFFNCPEGQQCFDGKCLVLGSEGDICQDNNECRNNLVCHNNICAAFSCFDSDGGGLYINNLGTLEYQYSVHGEVVDREVYYDYCADGDTVVERFCSGRDSRGEFVDCRDSRICNNGKCGFPVRHACDRDFDCASGLCASFRECINPLSDRLPCNRDEECESGYCGIIGGGGPAVCVPLNGQLEIGEVCNNDISCQSDFCDLNTRRCAKVSLGHNCVVDNDCYDGLLCDTGKCYYPCYSEDGSRVNPIDLDNVGTTFYARLGQKNIYEPKKDKCVLEHNTGTLERLEYFCQPDGSLGVLNIPCQGRQQCVSDSQECVDVDLKEEGENCLDDKECKLGLICQQGQCRDVDLGVILPETVGRICNNILDCIGDWPEYMSVCEDGLCRPGAMTDCRYGCSNLYPCDESIGLCAPPSFKRSIRNDLICRSDSQCLYGRCWPEPFGFGICGYPDRWIGESCIFDNDCRTKKCEVQRGGIEGKVCVRAPLFGYCEEDFWCQSRMCDRTINTCVSTFERTEPPMCGLLDVVPGFNQLDDDRINIVFSYTTSEPGGIRSRDYAKRIVKFLGINNKDSSSLFNLKPFKQNLDKFNIWIYPYSVEEDPSFLEPILAKSKKSCAAKCPVYGNSIGISDDCPLRNVYLMHGCDFICRSATSKLWSTFDKTAHDLLSDSVLLPNSVFFTLKGVNAHGEDVLYSDEVIGEVISHEFGHAFGNLRDEYVEGGMDSIPDFPNCAASRQEAVNFWGDLEDLGSGKTRVGFYQGCSYASGNIKSTKDSLMKGHLSNSGYGPVNIRHLCYLILKNTGNVDDDCMRFLLNAPRSSGYYSLATGNVVRDDYSLPEFQVEIGNQQQDQVQTISRKTKKIDTDLAPIPTEAELRRMWSKDVIRLYFKKEGENYEVLNYTSLRIYPYIPFFEETGIFDAEIVLTLNGKDYKKGVNLHPVLITEDFLEGPTMPEDNKDGGVNFHDLLPGKVKLVDYSEMGLNVFIVDVPVVMKTQSSKISKSLSMNKQNFKLRIVNLKEKLDISFICQGGSCSQEALRKYKK